MLSGTSSTKTFIARSPQDEARTVIPSEARNLPFLMATKAKFQAIRGTRDLLPPETALWSRVEEAARAVFGTFGFGEIRVPVFEPTELFARAVGGDTDIVSKEMYTFSDQPEVSPESSSRATRHSPLATSSISLRPEATASVCRAYIEHSMQQLPQPVKLYYMGPMFRRERPQKGRYRQFYQIGAEVLGGSDAPAIDAEVIEMVMAFFAKLGLSGAQLDINSIGHAADNCRRGYVAKLKSEMEKVRDKLGADSQRRIETNPLRVLDSKLEHEQPAIATLPKIADHLCDDCQTHYAAVKANLDLRGVAYRENWRLVRGLDYYMRTTFEITAQGLGSQNAVCGGGRYDGLVEILGGPPAKGVGFAIGEDRLILSLLEPQGESPVTSHQSLCVYIAWMGEKAYPAAIRAARNLRSAGISVELPPVELKFGKALGQADKIGAKFALILGDNEISEGLWTLKNLSDGSQMKVAESDLPAHLKL